MANTKEQQLQAFARRAVRVSRALWPTNVRRAIATGRMAQTRRRLIVTGRYWRRPSLSMMRFRDVKEWDSEVQRRPQGSPASTMNVVGIAMVVLVGASVFSLVAGRLWLPLILLIIALVAICLSLVIVRRRVLGKRRLQRGVERRSFPGVLSRTHSPNTPMPLEPPLVRVLETYDLSQSDVEHFLDLPEGGNTGGYSLESWKEAQTSLHRTGSE